LEASITKLHFKLHSTGWYLRIV